MAKASSSQAWLWHQLLSHLNFDTINLLSKNDIVTSLLKLKFVKDHLCSSCELGKAKRSSFKTKLPQAQKDGYTFYTWTYAVPCGFKDETPDVLIDFLIMIQRGIHAQLSKTRSLNYLSSSEFNFISDLEDQFEKEETNTMGEPTMEEYMTKTRDGYGSVGRTIRKPMNILKKFIEIVDLFHIPNITQDQEPGETLYQAWERFKELLMRCPQQYLTDMHEVILFYKGLEVPTRQILDSKGAIPTMTAANARIAI
ncbi:retrovirus-related pol polyprotein from transposon TNT 1-94 [Tanacetum coccineum]|uniref:Retrovirus-related pol polyprotein from transposon TNT 1-94 n=1 Tax=Tanacetum coccineum TaxID=301880 RepID=A0ABQ5CJ52_9ASTR